MNRPIGLMAIVLIFCISCNRTATNPDESDMLNAYS